MSSEPQSAPSPLLTSLLERCRALQDTLAALSAYQTEKRDLLGGQAVGDDLPRPLELNQLQNLIKAELRALERVASASASASASGSVKAASGLPTPPRRRIPSPDDDEEEDDEEDEEEDPRIAHVLRSSNLRYLEAVWGAACLQRDVVAFHRRFALGVDGEGEKKSAVTVDVVADSGRAWIKVSTISEKRMLFDLAKAGWSMADDEDAEERQSFSDGDSHSHSGSDDGSTDGVQDGAKIMAVVDNGQYESERERACNGANGAASTKQQAVNGAAKGMIGTKDQDDDSEDDASEGRSLLRTARQLQAAAQGTWVDYVHPRIVFVLPNIPADGPASPHAADVLRKVRAEGVEVRCGALPAYFSTFSSPSSHAQKEQDELFDHLLPALQPKLTSDVNLDCTILLALISDVSHHALEPTVSLHPAINRQIAREQQRPLLPIILYPALAGRTLHTATEAAVRMREIVGHIGTDTEKRRAELLLGEGSGKLDDPQLRAHEWNALSVHVAPPDFRVPIFVEPSEESHEEKKQSAAADDISEPANGNTKAKGEVNGIPPIVATALSLIQLSAVNRGVWLLGWHRGWTTVTSNRAVARQVEAAVERALAMEEENAKKSEQLLKQLKIDEDEGDDETNDVPWRRGPRVWALGTARSLVKKERGLRG